MTSRPLIVLSLEGLATSAISCYGSSWNKTPAIDAIASTGCVWDRWIATTDDPVEAFARAINDPGDDWGQTWQSRGSIELITDVESATDQFEQSCFDRVLSLHDRDLGPPDRPAEDFADTQFGQIVAAAIERDAQQEPWGVLWLHSGFLTRRWDAPRYLAMLDEAEEELSSPSDEVELLETESEIGDQLESLPQVFLDVVPPQIELSKDSHPDLVTSWMRTYGCQIRLVDVLIELLLASLRVEDPCVMIVGTSGFQLGQNGWIGHRQGPLRSCDVRLPMILSHVGPLRIPQLTNCGALAKILNDLSGNAGLSGSGRDEVESPPLWSPSEWAANDNLAIETRSSRSTFALNTSQWFYVQDGDSTEHLYLKPDDVDDFNDVGRIRQDVLEELSDAKK